jgi:hypothetical protein
MALIVAMGPPKKGNKMKKKEEVMLEDESDTASDMDFEDESEYDDLEDEESMDSEDEDMLFGDMDDSGDADLEMLIEDVMSAFEAKDSKQLMNALKDFIRSVMDKE